MPQDNAYRKLSGRTSVTYQRLYQGEDHLLVVDGVIQESYRRFYYKDIRAIFMGKSVRGAIYNLILGLIGLTLGMIALGGTTGAVITGGIFFGFFILIMLVNSAKGPTCQCYIVTAVQTFRIASLGRQAKARRVIAKITPLIRTAQTELSVESHDASAPPPPPDSRWAPPMEESV